MRNLLARFSLILLALLVFCLVDSPAQPRERGRRRPPQSSTSPKKIDPDSLIITRLESLQSMKNDSTIVELFPYMESFFEISRKVSVNSKRDYFASKMVDTYYSFSNAMKHECIHAFSPFIDVQPVVDLIYNETSNPDTVIQFMAAEVLYIWNDFKTSLPILLEHGCYATFHKYPKECMRDTLEIMCNEGPYKQRIWCGYALEQLGDNQTLINAVSGILKEAPIVTDTKVTQKGKIESIFLLARRKTTGYERLIARHADDPDTTVQRSVIQNLYVMYNDGNNYAGEVLDSLANNHQNESVRDNARKWHSYVENP